MSLTLYARLRERGKKDDLMKIELDPGLKTMVKNGTCTVFVDQTMWVRRVPIDLLDDSDDVIEILTDRLDTTRSWLYTWAVLAVGLACWAVAATWGVWR